MKFNEDFVISGTEMQVTFLSQAELNQIKAQSKLTQGEATAVAYNKYGQKLPKSFPSTVRPNTAKKYYQGYAKQLA